MDVKTGDVAGILEKALAAWFEKGERRMFHEKDIRMLDKFYFNIVILGDYDVTIQSKNTGHL